MPRKDGQRPGGCCAPPRDAASQLGTSLPQAVRAVELVDLEGGKFLMGTNDAQGYRADGEGPVREVTIGPFAISPYTVTNERFAAFIRETGYLTEAERFGWSFVFAGFLPDDFVETRGVMSTPWWRQVFGADWRHPEGPHSDVSQRANHPVVHVSWNDAQAYCRHTSTRLPTEAEWEYAARGGLAQRRYPWGDELTPGGRHLCNVWQGTFPLHNTREDGYVGTAPVEAFPPNGYGLYNMTGNVWEWCADWFDKSFHQIDVRVDPKGPPRGSLRVMRGGSYLCHESYCFRYRVAARSANTPDASTGNLGFRVAADS